MLDLVLTNFTSISNYIGLHVAKITGLIDEFANMGTVLPTELEITLLVASILAPELQAKGEAIENLADDKADWKIVTKVGNFKIETQ